MPSWLLLAIFTCWLLACASYIVFLMWKSWEEEKKALRSGTQIIAPAHLAMQEELIRNRIRLQRANELQKIKLRLARIEKRLGIESDNNYV